MFSKHAKLSACVQCFCDFRELIVIVGRPTTINLIERNNVPTALVVVIALALVSRVPLVFRAPGPSMLLSYVQTRTKESVTSFIFADTSWRFY